MTIGQKIAAGFAVVLALLLTTAAAGLYIISDVQYVNREFIATERARVDGALDIRFALVKQNEAYRGFLLFGEEAHLVPWREGEEAFHAAYQTMRERTTSDEGRAMLDEISALAGEWKEVQERAIELRRRELMEQALAITRVEITPIRQRIYDTVNSFVERQERIIAETEASLDMRISRVTQIMMGLSAFAVLIGVVLAAWITHTTTAQLREIIHQLATSTSEISAMTSQVASSAAETASAVSETTSTVEEVKQTALVSSQKAQAVSESSRSAAETARSGEHAVQETMEGMNRIRNQMESIAESVVRLSEQGQAIGEIIATVNDLAEQSNLLAVNAAIEAAHAGEQGKGFGVVAQEVRRLAEQSKQATSQVRTILGDIQKATSAAVMATEQGSKAVDEGVSQSAEAGQAIQVLADNLAGAAQAVTQIAASSQQQLAGMDQVALAMENINQASSQNVAGTRQSEEAAENLNILATRLRSLIEKQRN